MERVTHVRRRRHRARRSGRAGRPRQSASARNRLRSPQVGPIFEEYVASRRFRPGDVQPGSFFDTLPKADVVMMGHILHDWDLPNKKMLIGKAFEALPAGGALIVYEAIIDDDRSQERVRPDDEPEHADRDAGRLRLHRRGLCGLDERSWIPRRASSSWSVRTRWSSASSRRSLRGGWQEVQRHCKD